MSNFSYTARPFSACLQPTSYLIVPAVLLLLDFVGDPLMAAENVPPATPAARTSNDDTVTLASLVAAAKHAHPTAQAVAAARRAAGARADQARTWANPELEVSVGRTRPRLADLDADRPFGARLSQRVEWWGKRNARVAAATAQIAVADAEAAAALLDLEVEVRLAAIALATAQAEAVQVDAQASVAQSLADVVAKRQAAGDIDRGAVARAQLESTTARLHQQAAVRKVELQLALVRAWSGDGLPERVIVIDALVDPVVAADGTPDPAPSAHPRLRAALEAERSAEARATAERQARVPDLTVGVFGDREREKDTFGLSLGLEIPLWDRGSARVEEAESERAQRAAERSVATISIARERMLALGDWRSAAAEVIALRDQAVPVAEEAVQLRLAAFTGGEASLADVLEARHAALAVQADLLAARRRHAEAQVRLLAATGMGGQP